ncbi:Protein BIC1 [Zea mays]|uniref:Protein BIC1 n=1 Tax=Zea mays TaxID=4577 RepID=A0A3L6EVC6_MAIZE|nr:Protein BIC1 [Zea mays]
MAPPNDSEPCTHHRRLPADELQPPPATCCGAASDDRAPAAAWASSPSEPDQVAAAPAAQEAEKKQNSGTTTAAEAAAGSGAGRELVAARRPAEESARERLKRHRAEMAGRVRIPEMWGQERLLKDWVDCAVFDRPLAATAGLLTARDALVAECAAARRRPAVSHGSAGRPLRVHNGCS